MSTVATPLRRYLPTAARPAAAVSVAASWQLHSTLSVFQVPFAASPQQPRLLSTAAPRAAAVPATTTMCRARTALAAHSASWVKLQHCGVRFIRTVAPMLAGHKVKMKRWLDTVARYNGFMKPKQKIKFVVDIPEPDLPTFKYSYFIERTKSKNLPVYQEIVHRRHYLTVVRRIEGDITALAEELENALRKRYGFRIKVRINHNRMDLCLPGYRGDFVRGWLTEKGF